MIAGFVIYVEILTKYIDYLEQFQITHPHSHNVFKKSTSFLFVKMYLTDL